MFIRIKNELVNIKQVATVRFKTPTHQGDYFQIYLVLNSGTTIAIDFNADEEEAYMAAVDTILSATIVHDLTSPVHKMDTVYEDENTNKPY